MTSLEKFYLKEVGRACFMLVGLIALLLGAGILAGVGGGLIAFGAWCVVAAVKP